MSDKTITLTMEILYDKYITQGLSAAEIGKEFECHAKKIIRLLKKFNIPVRNREQARQLYEQQHGHPRKGTVLSEESKEKISESQSKNWTPERKTKQGQMISDKWKNNEYDSSILEKAHLGLREAAKNGSKVERIFCEALDEMGVKYITQASIMYDAIGMKVDIWIPSMEIAIECDGPSHVFPVWGQERLDKQITSDNEKNALLLSKGQKVMRLSILVKHISQKHTRQIKEFFKECLEITKKCGGLQKFVYGGNNIDDESTVVIGNLGRIVNESLRMQRLNN